MSAMIRGYWISQVVGTLAKLAIPDQLAAGPRSGDDLARRIGCDPEATARLLRAASALGLVSKTQENRFALTDLGELLADIPGSLRDSAIALTAPGHWLPWGRLSDAVRSGERQAPRVLCSELFHYYAEHPAEGRAFTGAMSASSSLIANEIARALDIPFARVVVDVGGASGIIITALLSKYPDLEGILLERPDVVPRARAAIAGSGLSQRCSVVAGDFFHEVPGADVYILKYIIHDWDDEQSTKILENCARRLRKGGRVVLIERIFEEGETFRDTALMDLNMLVLLPGRERSESQYGELLNRAGLRLDRIVRTSSPFNIIEASAL
jgi:SAM-dependent methyltransferase